MKYRTFAWKDIRRHKWIILMLMLEWLVISIYGHFTISLMHSSIANYKAMEKLASYDIVQCRPAGHNMSMIADLDAQVDA